MRRMWTMREVKVIRDNMSQTDAEIAEKLSRSRKSVEHQRLALVGRKFETVADAARAAAVQRWRSPISYLSTGVNQRMPLKSMI